MPRAPQTIIDIDLTGTEYADYKVSAASASLGQLLDLGDQPDRLQAGAGLSEIRELVELFASRIRSWNLEDEDGAELPINFQVILDLDFRFAAKLLSTWLNGMTDVDAGLGKDSTSGPPSAPPNFPMEAL